MSIASKVDGADRDNFWKCPKTMVAYRLLGYRLNEWEVKP